MSGVNLDASLNIYDQYNVYVNVLESPVVYALVLLVTVVSLASLIWYKGFRRMVSTKLYQRIQEVQISSLSVKEGKKTIRLSQDLISISASQQVAQQTKCRIQKCA